MHYYQLTVGSLYLTHKGLPVILVFLHIIDVGVELTGQKRVNSTTSQLETRI